MTNIVLGTVALVAAATFTVTTANTATAEAPSHAVVAHR